MLNRFEFVYKQVLNNRNVGNAIIVDLGNRLQIPLINLSMEYENQMTA